jgi:hypothetical protein
VRIRKIALQGAYLRICVFRTTGFPVLSTGSTASKNDQIHVLPVLYPLGSAIADWLSGIGECSCLTN